MDEDAARADLRIRQGAGARYDAATAPADDILLARRASAYFARLLNGLGDDALNAPSRVPGWTRAHVVSHVGYRARSLALMIEAVRTEPLLPPAVQRFDVGLGATLPARALRSLFFHAERHLSVEWRDLGDAEWDMRITFPDGTTRLLRDTPRLHARELYVRALDLDAGGSRRDMPQSLR